jgi:hypothetical protein
MSDDTILINNEGCPSREHAKRFGDAESFSHRAIGIAQKNERQAMA